MIIKSAYIKMEVSGHNYEGEKLNISVTEELASQPEDKFKDIDVLIGMQIIRIYKIIAQDFQIDNDTAKIVVGGKPYGERVLKKVEKVESEVKKPKSSSPFSKIAKDLTSKKVPEGL